MNRVRRIVATVAVGALAAFAGQVSEQAGRAEAVTIVRSEPLPPSVRTGVLGAENDNNVGLAVLDTETGAYYGSLNADTLYPAESVVKVLIAANLLATGQMSGAVESMAYQMIPEADDDDADDLWGDVGGPNVVGWAISYFGIPDLGAPPTSSGHWGNTKLSARGLVEFIAAVKANPVVGPWLLNAMGHTDPVAADGTDQDFGLPAQDDDVGAFKQGWGGDSDDDTDLEQLNSVGLLDGGRYAVALMVQHESSDSFEDMVPVITDLAAAVAPGGAVVPVPTFASPGASTTGTSAPGSGDGSSGSTGSTSSPGSRDSAGAAGRTGSAGSIAHPPESATALAHGRSRRIPLAVIGAAALIAFGLMLAYLRRSQRGRSRSI